MYLPVLLASVTNRWTLDWLWIVDILADIVDIILQVGHNWLNAFPGAIDVGDLATWNGRKSTAVKDFLAHLWFSVDWSSKSRSSSEVAATHIHLGFSGSRVHFRYVNMCHNWYSLGVVWMHFDRMEFQKSISKNAFRYFQREVWKGGTSRGRNYKLNSFSCKIQRHGNTHVCVVSLSFFKQEL